MLSQCDALFCADRHNPLATHRALPLTTVPMVDMMKMEDDLYRAQVEIKKQQEAIERLTLAVEKLETGTSTPTVGAPPIVNYIRNGDFSHSFDTWNRATPTADDARFECWEVYTHTAPVAGQQLLEDSVYSGALVAASTALPDVGRSDTPVVDPRWVRSIGYAELGSTNTLDFPLPSNFQPGRKLFVPLIIAKRSSDVGVPGRLFAGIWDNTAGQRDWLMGGTFEVTAQVIGTPASTTSTEYVVVMTSDYGATVKSSILTVPNAPSSGSIISGSVYVKLSWPRFPGFIHSDVYRKRGGVFHLLTQESTVNEYFDYDTFRQVVGNYPDTDATKPKALSLSRVGVFNDAPVDGVDPAWRVFSFAIVIPDTYNQGLTTGKQWLRIGLDAPCTGTDATRGLRIDLVGFSYTDGSYAHHTDDLKGLQQPISAPAGSTQGGAGTGGSGSEPPPGGTGDERLRCVMAGTMIRLKDSTFKTCRAEDLLTHPEYKLLSVDEDGKFVAGEIEKVSEAFVPFVYRLCTVTGETLRCSESHRLITYIGDPIGTAVSRLRVGDPVIVYDSKTNTLKGSSIKTLCRKTPPTKRVRVIQIEMKKTSPPTYLAGEASPNSLLNHNAKIQDQF